MRRDAADRHAPSELPDALVALGFALNDGVLSAEETPCRFSSITDGTCRVTTPDGTEYVVNGVRQISIGRQQVQGKGSVGIEL